MKQFISNFKYIESKVICKFSNSKQCLHLAYSVWFYKILTSKYESTKIFILYTFIHPHYIFSYVNVFFLKSNDDAKQNYKKICNKIYICILYNSVNNLETRLVVNIAILFHLKLEK